MTCVREICNGMAGIKSFFIPSYQRGYRWSELQVRMLLEDLKEAFDGKSDYCLQPLVVKKDEHCAQWRVIDGQQRLTTLSILLKVLDPTGESDIFLEYETRPGSKDFLKDLSTPSVCEMRKDANPDYHCMFQARRVFETLLEKWFQNPEGRTDFQAYIKDKVKFIWYELPEEEDEYETFEDLNSGKISLTNAELIKALLLRHKEKDDVSIVAQEWDRIEGVLRNDAFWYFVNPDAKAERFVGTRIDFLFETILRGEVHQKKKGDCSIVGKYLFDKEGNLKKQFEEHDSKGELVAFDYDACLQRNPYLIFSVFSEFVRSHGESAERVIWDDVKHLILMFESWYEGRSIFHLVGFLVNRRSDGKDKFAQLLDLENESRNRSHTNFRSYLLKEIQKKVFEKEISPAAIKDGMLLREKMQGWSYEKETDKRKMHNILLLFNVALTAQNDSEDVRFPFHKHAKMSDKWSLEHIHAKKEKFLVERKPDDPPSDLETYEQFLGLDGNGNVAGRVKTVNEALEKRHVHCAIVKERDNQGGEIYAIETTPDDEGMHSEEAESKVTCDMTHGIWNMALLDCRRNATFNNGIFVRKLKMLQGWELKLISEPKDDQIRSDYVPLGTKMAFHKEFSSLNEFPLAWTYKDRKDYFDKIVKVISAYLTEERKS